MKHHNHFQTYKPAQETRNEPPAWVIWAGAFGALVALYLLTLIAFSL